MRTRGGPHPGAAWAVLPPSVPTIGIWALGLLTVKLDLVEVAGLLLGQQGGVSILPGIHFVNREGAEPVAFIVLEWKSTTAAATAATSPGQALAFR